jgi:CubicO group peptidase (beta-lactamase class C family)
MLASQRQGFRSVADYLTTFVHDPLEGKPGGQFSYSNNGYILLGTVIEAVSGQSYDDYVRQHIYQPAGMAHSAAYELDTDPPNLATAIWMHRTSLAAVTSSSWG